MPRVELDHRSDTGWCDVSVRISAVDPDGRSRNVSDGNVSRTPADEGSLRLDLDPIAHRFAAGTRIRVSIAGGPIRAMRATRDRGTVWTATGWCRPGTRSARPPGSSSHPRVICAGSSPQQDGSGTSHRSWSTTLPTAVRFSSDAIRVRGALQRVQDRLGRA